MLLWVGDFKQV